MATLVKADPSVTESNDEKTNSISSEKSDTSTQNENVDEEDHLFKSWGFSLKNLFKLASTFFKEQEGKAFHPSYQHKVQLVAYHQQIQHGPFQTKHFLPLGPLDVIGKDRRQAWASLGDLSAKSAMEKYIELLHSICPLFQTYVEAHKRDLEEKERLRLEALAQKEREEEEEKERRRLEEEIQQQEAKEKLRQLQHKKMIQEALNQQTYHQFKAYAEQQFPGNTQQQAELISQLQEQHYQQYMRQVLQHQMNNNPAPFSPHSTSADDDEEEEEEDYSGDAATKSQDGSEDDQELGKTKGYGETVDPAEDVLCLATASMWTRKDIREFKESIRRDEGDGILKVGHGETVTVRVPTHADGTCLFWEFATDTYDIGFGVSFEWNSNPGTQVSVNISESEDEDLDDDEALAPGGDVEKGLGGELQQEEGPVRVIIPVYRRDCHEEVYVGSHVYPGRGVYLLKFDNSYSLWRSKVLYYRVYYTR